MPENECTAAVIAAGNSFDHARLTAQDLFTRDLDPLFLERYIRADSATATRDLSAESTAFYDRLVSEGCAYVIEIADKLPHFNAGAFAELLRRDRQILEVIIKVLDRIPERAQGEPAEARFATAYVRHLATKLDRLELFGLDFESDWYPLSVAYVSLRVEGSDEVSGRNIEERLVASHRTLLFGRAGSGKTTILQWIAVRAARSDFTGSLSKLNGYMPFFVRLREYVGKALPEPEQFVTDMAPMLAREMPQNWVRSQLRSGHAILLIDGVDELPPDEREKVVTWLRDLSELFPDIYYVVTARSAAVATNWLDELGFIRTSLEAMPPSLVAAFVGHWHDATRHRFPDNDERNRLAEYERSLLTAIDDDRYLRDLADTPLLAGLLCALNRHLRSQLPRRRSEIYAKALSMLDERDRQRKIAAGDVPMDLTAKTRLLADLALWMIRNGESEIDAGSATKLLGRSLSSLPSIVAKPEAVFRVLLERSGLLREPASGRVDFVHRTFEEYLAAWAAVDGNVIGELVRNANDDQWREVLVMAAGQANQPQTNQLMQGLLRRTIHNSTRVQRLLLAVACLEEIRSLDPKIRRSVEEIIPSLLPPRSMEQAEQLSKAGERLIPILDRHWSKVPDKGDETIRAASLVGGPLALELIQNVTSHLGTEMMGMTDTEVMRAWQYFDVEEYARRVLAPMGASSVIVDDINRIIRALPQLTSLKMITINPFKSAIKFEGLSALPKLDTISFADVRAEQLLGISQCRQIKNLILMNYLSENFLHLELSPTLESLYIGSSPVLTGLAGIRKYEALNHITLDDCPSLRSTISLSELSDLKKLQTVTIRNSHDFNRSLLEFLPSRVEVEFT